MRSVKNVCSRKLVGALVGMRRGAGAGGGLKEGGAKRTMERLKKQSKCDCPKEKCVFPLLFSVCLV